MNYLYNSLVLLFLWHTYIKIIQHDYSSLNWKNWRDHIQEQITARAISEFNRFAWSFASILLFYEQSQEKAPTVGRNVEITAFTTKCNTILLLQGNQLLPYFPRLPNECCFQQSLSSSGSRILWCIWQARKMSCWSLNEKWISDLLKSHGEGGVFWGEARIEDNSEDHNEDIFRSQL